MNRKYKPQPSSGKHRKQKNKKNWRKKFLTANISGISKKLQSNNEGDTAAYRIERSSWRLIVMSGEKGTHKNYQRLGSLTENYGQFGREILTTCDLNKITITLMTEMKGYKSHVKLIPGSQPKLCKAKEVPLPRHYKATENLEPRRSLWKRPRESQLGQ